MEKKLESRIIVIKFENLFNKKNYKTLRGFSYFFFLNIKAKSFKVPKLEHS